MVINIFKKQETISESNVAFPNNCPILERTSDGKSAGRCWYYLSDQHICPRHGDVSEERNIYIDTGHLTDENDFNKKIGIK